MLEIEPQHPQALGFLGIVYHLLEDTQKAIEKYHEVRISSSCRVRRANHLVTFQKALSIDPINSHLIELLNLALESSIANEPIGRAYPGGDEAFTQMMRNLKEKYLKMHSSGVVVNQTMSMQDQGEPSDASIMDEAMHLG